MVLKINCNVDIIIRCLEAGSGPPPTRAQFDDVFVEPASSQTWLRTGRRGEASTVVS